MEKYGDPLSQSIRHPQAQLAHRLLAQTRTSEHKLDSIHAPEVGWIAKGTAHKWDEFEGKASFVTTRKYLWIVAVQA